MNAKQAKRLRRIVRLKMHNRVETAYDDRIAKRIQVGIELVKDEEGKIKPRPKIIGMVTRRLAEGCQRWGYQTAKAGWKRSPEARAMLAEAVG